MGAEKFFDMGQSQSLVEIQNKSGVLKIAKSSPLRESRFEAQYNKHKEAEKSKMTPILVPSVLSDLVDFRYEMEYVYGVPLGNFIDTCDQQELQEPLGRIGEYFHQSLKNADWTKSDNLQSAFKEKLSKLKTDITNDNQNSLLFYKLLNFVELSIDKTIIPAGWNHGDFSFENILVGQYSHETFALDFLDSPFESPLIDIGRIWLDSRFGWWGVGLQPNSCYQLNSKVLSASIIDTITPHSITVSELNIFAALAILRIRPYTLNPLRMAFLKNAALQILGGKI